ADPGVMSRRARHASDARADGSRARRLGFVLSLAVVLCGAIGALPRASEAQTLRVASSGQNSVGCGAAATPCRTIQYAVNQIASKGVVLVAGSAGGTRYTYDAATDPCVAPIGMTGIVCVINKQITIQGGFSTANWSTSDPAANLTIIDGQNATRGVLT